MVLKKKTKSAASFTPIRFGLLCVAILGCLGLLLVRVGWLQIISPDNLVKQEDMRSLREEPVAVERGMISDREGRPLAVSVPVSAIWIDPQTTMEKGGVGYGPRWQAMAEALHLNLGELAQRVQSHPHARFLYLARQINPEQAEWIDKLHLPGVYLRDESRRFYPAGHVAANLLGFTNVDNQGIEGVEKSFNAQLTGKPGRRLVRKDKHGNVIENITEVPPVPAHNLQLSI
ncbi:TPA: peptidoglycan synthase, partial [Klebsiella pneumoniae]